MTNAAIRPFNFKFGLKRREIIGGPYHHKPDDHFGIKMAAEIEADHDVSIPTEDFSIPAPADLDVGLRKSLMVIARKEKVYCGCKGGIGRTGLFFGALMKALGEEDPVGYVRGNYKGHAIETKAQQKMVNEYNPSLKTKAVLTVAKAVALFY